MSRSMPVTIAAILQFSLSAVLIIGTVPDLAQGATPQAGGFSGYMVTVCAFTAGVLGIVAGYSTWVNMKRGKILSLVVNVMVGFLLLGAVLFASPNAKIVAGAMLAVPIVSIILLLWRTPEQVRA